MNKSFKFLFIVSIVLNVLFVGLLLGALPHRFGPDFSRRERMESALQELPEPTRSQVRDKMKQARADAGPFIDQIRDARTEAVRILTAEPFDETAYDTQVNKIVDLRVEMTKRMAATFKEAAKSLPPDQRGVLAKVLNRPPRPR
jgi:uncharacterized membrane protein